jgi:hypothetical protein
MTRRRVLRKPGRGGKTSAILVLLVGDLAHRLEEPQLQSRRALEPVRRLPQPLGGLVLPLRSDDLGPPLALAHPHLKTLRMLTA